jgi:hypothetical protein
MRSFLWLAAVVLLAAVLPFASASSKTLKCHPVALKLDGQWRSIDSSSGKYSFSILHEVPVVGPHTVRVLFASLDEDMVDELKMVVQHRKRIPGTAHKDPLPTFPATAITDATEQSWIPNGMFGAAFDAGVNWYNTTHRINFIFRGCNCKESILVLKYRPPKCKLPKTTNTLEAPRAMRTMATAHIDADASNELHRTAFKTLEADTFTVNTSLACAPVAFMWDGAFVPLDSTHGLNTYVLLKGDPEVNIHEVSILYAVHSTPDMSVQVHLRHREAATETQSDIDDDVWTGHTPDIVDFANSLPDGYHGVQYDGMAVWTSTMDRLSFAVDGGDCLGSQVFVKYYDAPATLPDGNDNINEVPDPSVFTDANEVDPLGTSSVGGSLGFSHCSVSNIDLGPGITFFPAFNTDTRVYTCVVNPTTLFSSVTVDPDFTSAAITITVNGGQTTQVDATVPSSSLQMFSGSNEVVVVVHDDPQCANTYTFDCVRGNTASGAIVAQWYQGPWSECIADCNDGNSLGTNGVQNHTVYCADENLQQVVEANCAGQPKPDVTIQCIAFCPPNTAGGGGNVTTGTNSGTGTNGGTNVTPGSGDTFGGNGDGTNPSTGAGSALFPSHILSLSLVALLAAIGRRFW